MSLHRIRHKLRYFNIKYLVLQYGGPTKFNKKVAMRSARINQAFKDKPIKNIGDVLARCIEIKCGMPRGWLDEMHPYIQYDDAVYEFVSNLFNNIKYTNKL